MPSGLDVKRDPGRRDLSFLSTSRRFDAPETGARSRAPGPGSYVTAPSDFDRAGVLPRGRPRRFSHTAPVGFQSTTLRFAGKDLRMEQEGLGPASYSVSGMAEEIARKGSSGNGKKVGAFGSTTRRFPVTGAGQPSLPGPGSYELGVEAGSASGAELDERPRYRRSTASTGTAGKRLPSALSSFASGGWRKRRSENLRQLLDGYPVNGTGDERRGFDLHRQVPFSRYFVLFRTGDGASALST